jgi:transmembrane sensor
MNLYDRIIENPLFFKWIFHPSPEINAYWSHYLETNPGQAEKINELKAEIEIHLKYEGKVLTEYEKRALARRIVLMLERTDRLGASRRFMRSTLRYAAIALLFLTIGGSLVYIYMESRQPQLIVDHSALPAHMQEPVLIIGDSEQIPLNRGESQLDYSAKGEIMLNRETIRKEKSDDPPQMNTLVIPYGNRSVITLADGSKVWLNAGSRLIYPSRFVDKTREVFLTGEAFFDVQQNQQQFVVKTVDVNIKVLGTRFNVSAYPEDYAVQTVLAEGKVEIKRTGALRNEKGVNLEPGYMAYFNRKTQQTQTQLVNVNHHTLWTEGLFSFSNTDFNRIIKKLERYYNIQFQFDDPFKGGIQVSGKLDVNQEREQVFETLERLTGLNFIQINERHFLIK